MALGRAETGMRRARMRALGIDPSAGNGRVRGAGISRPFEPMTGTRRHTRGGYANEAYRQYAHIPGVRKNVVPHGGTLKVQCGGVSLCGQVFFGRLVIVPLTWANAAELTLARWCATHRARARTPFLSWGVIAQVRAAVHSSPHNSTSPRPGARPNRKRAMAHRSRGVNVWQATGGSENNGIAAEKGIGSVLYACRIQRRLSSIGTRGWDVSFRL